MVGKVLSHYKILEKLGEGGMGVVYRAEDTRLRRTVSLKFLSTHVSTGGVERERLLREAQAASALNHPNASTVYSIEEADGDTFIVMEFVDGVTLRRRIDEGGFQPAEAIEVALQIADALREAHRLGIVHRDIKPENVMINTRGQVKVMDFGLATLKDSPRLTLPSRTVGTLAYMAPEQFQGLPTDSRSDIFSFGVVFFEMLTGQRPFRGEHEAAIMYSLMHEEAPNVSTLSRGTPAHLDRLVRRSLEKDPARRYQSMEELLRDLRSSSSPVRASIVHMAIAVLPFQNISPDANNEYFSDGLTEEIIATLSKIRTLKVVSRTSVMRYKGSQLPIRDIAQELQVQYVLEGSVRKHANDLRITAQLIDAADDSHLWAEKYRGTMEDVFDIQEQVAGQIAEALKVRLTADEHDLLRKRLTENAEAYELYLKGRFFWNRRTEQGVRKGIEHFEAAIRSDPSFTLAHVGLADSYNILGFYSYASPREAFPKAKEAAAKALAIDEGLAEAHASLGYALFYYDWKWVDAEQAFRRAIELNPLYATAPQFYANFLAAMGRSDEANSAFKRAHEIDPLSLIINAGIAWGFYFARRFEESVAQSKRTLDMDDNFAVGHQWLARAYVQMGNISEAIPEFDRAISITGRDPCVLAELAHAHALAGRRDEALMVRREIESMRPRRYLSPYHLADLDVGLGDFDAAITGLQKALEDRCREMVLLKVEPRLDPLRSDPRFTELIHVVGLE